MNKLQKSALTCSAVALMSMWAEHGHCQGNARECIDVTNVSLTSPHGEHSHCLNGFTPNAFKHAEEMDICYLLSLDADRLLAPYRKEANLPSPRPNYTNWENTGLDGHVGGHYLSALAYMYAATGNDRIGERLRYMVTELKKCQDAASDGYLCGVPGGRQIWEEIRKGQINASSFGLNNRWVPLYNIHKTFAGLRDAYLTGGIADAKEMFLSLTEWMHGITANLTDDQIQQMLASEHGGLNEVFADAYAISGNEKYLAMAKRFCHQTLLQPLAQGDDKLTGMHANTQIPKVIGFERIAELTNDAELHKAAENFWQMVVGQRTISIGGNSVYEHFHPSDNYHSMINSEQGPETCNTYNMLRLTRMLYERSGNARYADYYERALYNHILSTIHPVQGGFVYFTPMRAGHYRVYSQPQTSFWCCVGSGLENHARYGEMIYAQATDSAFVNLFIPSEATFGKLGLALKQETDFPSEAATTITVSQCPKQAVTLSVRKPQWCKGIELKLNGKRTEATESNGYINLTRRWRAGDKLTISLPMELSLMQLPDGSDYYSVLYGPIVLGADMGHDNQKGLFADDSRGGHIASGPFYPTEQVPVVIADASCLIDSLRCADAANLRFEIPASLTSTGKSIELKPFASLYERRYMVYFPVLSVNKYTNEWQPAVERERQQRELEEATLDKITCGEQQPESDHFVEFTDAITGFAYQRHWRAAKGSISYQMTGKGTALRLEYEADEDCRAIITVNGTEAGRITDTTNGISVMQIELPPAEGVRSVRIECAGQTTPKIFSLRILK